MRLIIYLTFGMFMSICSLSLADDKNSINSACDIEKTMNNYQCLESSIKDKPLVFSLFFLGGMTFVIFICEFTGIFNQNQTSRIFLDITKCSKCGETFTSGAIWCGNESCKEKWREKDYV
jgi:hypothetical protein